MRVRTDSDQTSAPVLTDGHATASSHGAHRTSASGDVDVTGLMRENANLRAQLETLPVIEQAKGIVMARYRIDADAAFVVLRRWSSHTSTKLRDISRLLVDATAQPSAEAHADGHHPQHTSTLDQLVAQHQRGSSPPRSG